MQYMPYALGLTVHILYLFRYSFNIYFWFYNKSRKKLNILAYFNIKTNVHTSYIYAYELKCENVKECTL